MTEELKPVAWMYEKAGHQAISLGRVTSPRDASADYIETPLYTRPTPPAVSDDLVEELGMALCQNALGGKKCPCVEAGKFSCADAYPGQQASAILPIIQRREQQAAEAGLAELLEAWLHTTDDQDTAHCGITVLAAIRALPSIIEHRGEG